MIMEINYSECKNDVENKNIHNNDWLCRSLRSVRDQNQGEGECGPLFSGFVWDLCCLENCSLLLLFGVRGDECLFLYNLM